MEMKHYVDISRLKAKYSEMFDIGEHVVVQTKVDGANASMTYDKETDSIVAFSRKTKLSETNNLRGFWEWTQRFPIEDIKEITEFGRYLVFGEWLVPHAVKYPDTAYNKFYMFDAYDCIKNCYIPYHEAWIIFGKLLIVAEKSNIEINFVPVLYDGKFNSWEDLMELMKLKTLGGQPVEEGIVIKTQDRLEDKENSRRPKYIKIVNEQFGEVHKGAKKPIDPEVLKQREEARNYVAQFATRRRIEKIILKLVDEGQLPIDWDETNMKEIAKIAPKLVYEDIKKEEPEAVLAIEGFGKFSGSITMEIIRSMLNER